MARISKARLFNAKITLAAHGIPTIQQNRAAYPIHTPNYSPSEMIEIASLIERAKRGGVTSDFISREIKCNGDLRATLLRLAPANAKQKSAEGWP